MPPARPVPRSVPERTQWIHRVEAVMPALMSAIHNTGRHHVATRTVACPSPESDLRTTQTTTLCVLDRTAQIRLFGKLKLRTCVGPGRGSRFRSRRFAAQFNSAAELRRPPGAWAQPLTAVLCFWIVLSINPRRSPAISAHISRHDGSSSNGQVGGNPQCHFCDLVRIPGSRASCALP
jgi:hypothetical protein